MWEDKTGFDGFLAVFCFANREGPKTILSSHMLGWRVLLSDVNERRDWEKMTVRATRLLRTGRVFKDVAIVMGKEWV